MGKNVAAALTGDGEIKPFVFTGLGELASIGHHAAVAEIMGLQFHGFIAWWMWRTIYLMKLPGLERKVRVMLDWTLDLFFPRDIAVLQPKPTRLIAEMHLDSGDYVFHAGDPARRLYILKAGKLELRDGDGAVVRTLSPVTRWGSTLSRSKSLGPSVQSPPSRRHSSRSAAASFEAVVQAGATIDEVFALPPQGEASQPATNGQAGEPV